MLDKFLNYFRDDTKYHLEIMLFGLGALFAIVGIGLTASGIFAPLGIPLTLLGVNGVIASPAVFLISNTVFSFGIGGIVALVLHTLIKSAVGTDDALTAKDSEIKKEPDLSHDTNELIPTPQFSGLLKGHRTSDEAVDNAGCFSFFISYFFRKSSNSNDPIMKGSTQTPVTPATYSSKQPTLR